MALQWSAPHTTASGAGSPESYTVTLSSVATAYTMRWGSANAECGVAGLAAAPSAAAAPGGVTGGTTESGARGSKNTGQKRTATVGWAVP